MPFTLAAPVHSELLIKKSRFIGCVEPVSGREQAVARVQELWVQYPDARHICWALMAGGHSAAVDDGEPSGTAGRPMLDVLGFQARDGGRAPGARYSGGGKRGAGGLVRAYTDAVAQALVGAERVPLVRTRMLRVTVPYALEGVVRRELDAHGATLGDVTHGDGVTLAFALPEDRAVEVAARIDDASQGRAVWG